MINNVPPSPYVNTTTGLPPANNVAPTTGVPPTNYPTDGFSPSSSYASLASTPNSYPLSQIMFEQPSLSSRMGTFFMGSSDSFLKVGTTWIGRQFINLLSGNIPILTSKSAATQISNNINLWLGRSDLVRVGANPFEASLLQEVGVKNVNDLAILTNPGDQAVVSSMVMAAAAAKGQIANVTPMTISSWVANAQALPKYF